MKTNTIKIFVFHLKITQERLKRSKQHKGDRRISDSVKQVQGNSGDPPSKRSVRDL